jgi:predicted kinase
MTGLPASGKSTLARALGVPRFNLDDYRAMLGFRDEWSREREHIAVEAMVAGVVAAVDSGHDAVLDNCHVSQKLPKLYKTRFIGRDVVFEVHDLTDVPIEECIARDALRTGSAHVGEDVIRKLAKSMAVARKGGWRLTDEWMNDRPVVEPYVPNESLPRAIGFDLDGTLALHVARGPFEFDKMETDAVNVPVARLLRIYHGIGIHPILLSGGQGEYKANRERWLAANDLPYHEFHTRRVGDQSRPDDVVKLELFNEFVRDRYNMLGIYDDRNRVVALWRRLNLLCLQVAEGNF